LLLLRLQERGGGRERWGNHETAPQRHHTGGHRRQYQQLDVLLDGDGQVQQADLVVVLFTHVAHGRP